ncbi:unnamed protein product [Cladocopium goreaui]|uniref:Uncharacterized protein n=1 Tax=Cladocopium goreaui TaxID=2562237 RepID=A0A9P1G861_9DINO|nr:unnamed protein product [Cladocopium goreaui]
MPPRKLKRSVSADVEGRPSKAPAEIAVSGLDSEPAEAAGASKEAGDAGDAGDVKISRFANQDLVRDVVIGYTGDEDEDPPQAGSSKERHNRDVQQMISEGLDVPIAKDQRSSYVWVAASKVPENQGVEGNIEMRKKKYTWNPEEIQPVDAVRSKQLRCDICGALCTEVLYEFRCYKRMRPDEPRSVGRRLHPFVSYISKECGQGLLGNPSGASKLRERIYRLLMDTDGLSAVEELEAMQKHEKCVSSRKETVEHFTSLYITLHHFTSLYTLFLGAGSLAPW